MEAEQEQPRHRITLFEQMNSNNNTRISLATLLQNDVVLAKTPTQTLLDIIQQQNQPNNNVVHVNNSDNKDRKSWNFLRELLRLRRRNSDESTHQHQEQGNSDPTELVVGGESSDETAQVSMSLMDLLEESEIDLELDRSIDVVGGDVEESEKIEEEEEEEEENGREGNVKVEHNCCVCMVRHKGAAFIPCGHTFCRTCSRELWVSRGNCPLCNNLILEVLDIF